MKTHLIAILLTTSSLTSASLFADTAVATVSQSSFVVSNMHCPPCAQAILARVQQLDGVSSATLTFEEPTLVVEWASPAARDDHGLLEAISVMGYEIAAVEASEGDSSDE